MILEKKNLQQTDYEKQVALFQEAFGLSKHDSEALLVQAAEIPTADSIPLDELNEYAKVDSTPTTLNNLHAENTSAILDRNMPR